MIAVLAVDEVKVKRVDDDSHSANWIAVNRSLRLCDVITIVADSAERARDIDVAVQNVRNFVQNVKSKKHKINTFEVTKNVVLRLHCDVPLTVSMSNKL